MTERTEEQVKELLDRLDDGSAKEDIPMVVRDNLRLVVKLCRLQAEQIKDLQKYPDNIGLGLKIIGSIGAFGAICATIFGVIWTALHGGSNSMPGRPQ